MRQRQVLLLLLVLVVATCKAGWQHKNADVNHECSDETCSRATLVMVQEAMEAKYTLDYKTAPLERTSISGESNSWRGTPDHERSTPPLMVLRTRSASLSSPVTILSCRQDT